MGFRGCGLRHEIGRVRCPHGADRKCRPHNAHSCSQGVHGQHPSHRHAKWKESHTGCDPVNAFGDQRIWVAAYKWPIYFFVAVAFWNFVGAGLFGFFINPPISAGGVFNSQMAALANASLQSYSDAYSYIQALRTTVDRYLSAIQVGDLTAANLQASHALFQSLDKVGIWVDRLALPPFLFWPKLKHGEMQVGHARVRVSRRSDIRDDVSAFHAHSFAQTFRVTVEVSIVIRIATPLVEFINGITACLAEEQLADRSGNCREHRRAARGNRARCARIRAGVVG